MFTEVGVSDLALIIFILHLTFDIWFEMNNLSLITFY
jgi:hypothetical protein